MSVFKVVDWNVSLKVFVEYVVSLLIGETLVDCCSFDVVGEVIVCTSLNEF